MVDASIAAGVKGLQTTSAIEQKQTAADALAASKRAQNYALALASILKDDPSQVQAAYQSAAQNVQGYGTGLTGAVFDEQQKAANDAAEAVSRMTGGVNTTTSAIDPAAARSAMLYSNVVIPGTTLEAQGAQAYGSALSRAQVARSGVEGVAQDYIRKGLEAKQRIRTQTQEDIAKLQAQRPDLTAKAAASMVDAANQKRAIDVQVGTLQLQQAKTEYDRALALTNVTGNLWVVNSKGVAVDTGRPAPGSDAVQIATTAATARAGITAATARANADRKVRQEIAAQAAAARVSAAQTAAQARVTAAQTAAAAKKAAAAVKRQADANKPASPKQRSDIIKNVNAQGGELVQTTVKRIIGLIPGLAKQGPNETTEEYNKRHNRGLDIYRGRLREHRAEIVTRVANLITPQLTLLKYGPDQIGGMADAIVSAYIPKQATASPWVPPSWKPTGVQGPLG